MQKHSARAYLYIGRLWKVPTSNLPSFPARPSPELYMPLIASTSLNIFRQGAFQAMVTCLCFPDVFAGHGAFEENIALGFFGFCFFFSAVGRRKTTLTSGPRGFSTSLTASVSSLTVDEGYRLKQNHVNRSLHFPATAEKKCGTSVCLFRMLRRNMGYYYDMFVYSHV